MRPCANACRATCCRDWCARNPAKCRRRLWLLTSKPSKPQGTPTQLLPSARVFRRCFYRQTLSLRRRGNWGHDDSCNKSGYTERLRTHCLCGRFSRERYLQRCLWRRRSHCRARLPFNSAHQPCQRYADRVYASGRWGHVPTPGAATGKAGAPCAVGQLPLSRRGLCADDGESCL